MLDPDFVKKDSIEKVLQTYYKENTSQLLKRKDK
jgi:hypothetical protein